MLRKTLKNNWFYGFPPDDKVKQNRWLCPDCARLSKNSMRTPLTVFGRFIFCWRFCFTLEATPPAGLRRAPLPPAREITTSATVNRIRTIRGHNFEKHLDTISPRPYKAWCRPRPPAPSVFKVESVHKHCVMPKKRPLNIVLWGCGGDGV